MRVLILVIPLMVFGAMARAASAPAPEAVSALVPYAMWVGRMPVPADVAWNERKRLAFLRGRLGAWLEAELQVKSARSAPVRQAELAVQVARAARYQQDWERARTWRTLAREAMNRVPEADRPFNLVAGYHEEVVAAREVTDVRAAYAAMTPFLRDESARRENLNVLQRLVDWAVVAGDAESYSKLATSLLTTARAWTREAPAADGGPSEAERALGAYIETLITRGYAATAIQLADTGLGHEAMRRALMRAAEVAVVARESDAAVGNYLANQATPADRASALFGVGEHRAGLIDWLGRGGRAEFAYQLLAESRDRIFPAHEETVRAHYEAAWNATVRRVAKMHLAAGRADEITRLGRLFTAAGGEVERAEAGQAGAMLSGSSGLVAFAAWLGAHGETAEAQRLLATLPFDYPREQSAITESNARDVMREGTAGAVLHQARVDLVLAWAAAGDAQRAAEELERLSADDRGRGAHRALVRPRLLAAIAAAAAIQGETDRAMRAVDEARAASHAGTEGEAIALVAALVHSGRNREAWEELVDRRGSDAESLLAPILATVVARARGNRALEWISVAPDFYRLTAWIAFFAATVPEPAVPPLGPAEG